MIEWVNRKVMEWISEWLSESTWGNERLSETDTSLWSCNCYFSSFSLPDQQKTQYKLIEKDNIYSRRQEGLLQVNKNNSLANSLLLDPLLLLLLLPLLAIVFIQLWPLQPYPSLLQQLEGTNVWVVDEAPGEGVWSCPVCGHCKWWLRHDNEWRL